MKKSFRKIACLIAIAATTMGAAMAQEAEPATASNKKVEFSVHLGGGIPLGKFGKAGIQTLEVSLNKPYYGEADLGINVEAKLKYNISAVKGLGITAAADLFYNTAFSSEEDYISDGFQDIKYEYPSYINIPVMFGVNYDYCINSKFSIWGEAGLGANIRIITPLSVEMTPTNAKSQLAGFYYIQNAEYDNSITFAFQGGIGVRLMDKLSLGVHYYNLGSSTVKGKYEYRSCDYFGIPSEGESTFECGELNTSLLVFRLGYHF